MSALPVENYPRFYPSIMEFVPLLQTAAFTALIAAIVTVFTAAQSAYLNVQFLYKFFLQLRHTLIKTDIG